MVSIIVTFSIYFFLFRSPSQQAVPTASAVPAISDAATICLVEKSLIIIIYKFKGLIIGTTWCSAWRPLRLR